MFTSRQIPFSEMKPGYAMTVHKIQGSEVPYVIIVLHKNDTHMNRTLLYTAFTRAMLQVIIIAPTMSYVQECISKCRPVSPAVDHWIQDTSTRKRLIDPFFPFSNKRKRS